MLPSEHNDAAAQLVSSFWLRSLNLPFTLPHITALIGQYNHSAHMLYSLQNEFVTEGEINLYDESMPLFMPTTETTRIELSGGSSMSYIMENYDVFFKQTRPNLEHQALFSVDGDLFLLNLSEKKILKFFTCQRSTLIFLSENEIIYDTKSAGTASIKISRIDPGTFELLETQSIEVPDKIHMGFDLVFRRINDDCFTIFGMAVGGKKIRYMISRPFEGVTRLEKVCGDLCVLDWKGKIAFGDLRFERIVFTVFDPVTNKWKNRKFDMIGKFHVSDGRKIARVVLIDDKIVGLLTNGGKLTGNCVWSETDGVWNDFTHPASDVWSSWMAC